MPKLTEAVMAEYLPDYVTGVMLVDDYQTNGARQGAFYHFQQGFTAGCHWATDYPDEGRRLPTLKRPVDPYVYGFRQGIRYVRRARTTTKPMQYDASVWRGFQRWERNYQED